MGTISDKLMRIINTKEDIRQALILKGYDVPTSIPFKEYAKMISDLPCKVDDFPKLPGDVTRWHFGGLTNEMMAAMDDPRIEDADHKGRFLSFKNFAWGGMSGVNGYVQNFNYFRNNATVDKVRIDEQSSNSIKVTLLTSGMGHAIFIPKDVYQFNKSYFIKISSEGYNEGDLFLSFYAPSTSTATTVKVPLNPNGITEIPAIKEDDFLAVYLFNAAGKVGSITIEQLPLYPGALVFDGVDDYGVCENFPILTKEKGYTVVALRQWDQDFLNTTLTGGLLSTRNYSTGEGVAFEKIESSNKGYWNLGAGGIIDFAKSPFTWQTSKQYNNVGILKGDKNHGKPLCVGCGLSGGQQCGRFAIWELVILDHDATEEELTKIKDYFVKTYPWLFFDQAWTVVGKTNEDEDRATIANITGNGNDLVLSNFGFAEGSGYGLYVENYSNSRWFINNSITGTKKSDTFNVTSINQVAVQIQYIAEPSQSPYTVPSYTIKVTGLTDGQTVNYRVSGGISYPITQDGIYILPGFDFAGMGSWYGFQFNKVQETCDITIEQIPEYEGYLVTDGVDDKVQSSSFTMNEDWTIVGDWELLSNVQINCGIVKAQNVYLYNTANGLLISINNPRSLQSFGTKSLHAICSDGRLYDLNWVEYEYTVDQNFEIVESSLNIGFNLNNYTQIAFKNLGIYNNQILSKDDCIKAYNYLQTLKSK